MSNVAVHVEGISKHYRLGGSNEAYGTLRDTLVSAAKTPMRALRGRSRNQPDGFWALRDVSFDVKHGEVLGIIGRNGAGKSTLLKILSRITEPTTGRATIAGRVGSLLEVGTGFHPELTGRENVYLNGAILGISKRDIDRRFDEIVEFAGVEQFLDTPVKRYSSGMYTRLAFSVAAHLEPEILIVDEVLSVGDAEFQRKSIGKMSDVAGEGRTVLFVSHNMSAVRTLCSKALLIADGKIAFAGSPTDAITRHLDTGGANENDDRKEIPDSALSSSSDVSLLAVQIENALGRDLETFDGSKPIRVAMTYEIHRQLQGLRINLALLTEEGELAFLATDHDVHAAKDVPGVHQAVATIPDHLLNRRTYIVGVGMDIPGERVVLARDYHARMIIDGPGHHGSAFPEKWPGVVSPRIEWTHDDPYEN